MLEARNKPTLFPASLSKTFHILRVFHSGFSPQLVGLCIPSEMVLDSSIGRWAETVVVSGPQSPAEPWSCIAGPAELSPSAQRWAGNWVEALRHHSNPALLGRALPKEHWQGSLTTLAWSPSYCPEASKHTCLWRPEPWPLRCVGGLNVLPNLLYHHIRLSCPWETSEQLLALRRGAKRPSRPCVSVREGSPS